MAYTSLQGFTIRLMLKELGFELVSDHATHAVMEKGGDFRAFSKTAPLSKRRVAALFAALGLDERAFTELRQLVLDREERQAREAGIKTTHEAPTGSPSDPPTDSVH